MSKVVTSLSRELMKNSVIGALISLGSYIALQFADAALIHAEVVGEGALYSLVCVSAAVAAFLGCGYSVLRGGSGKALGAGAVILVFLTLTVAVALLGGEIEGIGERFVGVGASMAGGGLLAALLGSAMSGKRKTRREKTRGRRGE